MVAQRGGACGKRDQHRRLCRRRLACTDRRDRPDRGACGVYGPRKNCAHCWGVLANAAARHEPRPQARQQCVDQSTHLRSLSLSLSLSLFLATGVGNASHAGLHDSRRRITTGRPTCRQRCWRGISCAGLCRRHPGSHRRWPEPYKCTPKICDHCNNEMRRKILDYTARF